MQAASPLWSLSVKRGDLGSGWGGVNGTEFGKRALRLGFKFLPCHHLTCVILDKLINLSEPLSPHPYTGHNNSYPTSVH